MKTILAIQSYPGANATVARHLPYYLNAGADMLLGIGTTDGGCVWSNEFDCTCNIGENKYIEGAHLCDRLLRTIEVALSVELGPFDRICVIEYDCLFFKPIPKDLPVGVVMNIAGGPQPHRLGTFYYHCPWIMDSGTASMVLDGGRQCLKDLQFEGGSTDCFIGWVCERFNIPVHCNLVHTYSKNSLDIPEHLEEARQARIDGAMAIHGVKTPAMLNRLMEN